MARNRPKDGQQAGRPAEQDGPPQRLSRLRRVFGGHRRDRAVHTTPEPPPGRQPSEPAPPTRMLGSEPQPREKVSTDMPAKVAAKAARPSAGRRAGGTTSKSAPSKKRATKTAKSAKSSKSSKSSKSARSTQPTKASTARKAASKNTRKSTSKAATKSTTRKPAKS